jgi:hypothetical protein
MRGLGHPGLVPAAATVRHLNLLLEAGMTWVQIVESAGVSLGTLRKLRLPGAEKGRILATTHVRMLSVPVPTREQRTLGEARVDGTGTRRRLQALARAGWGSPALTEHTSISESQLRRMLRWPQVTVGTRARVMSLYALLENEPGPSVEAARRAERKGWLPPSAWDGLDIDDPAVRPAEPARILRPLATAEDADFIRRTTGATDDQIAARLGMSKNTLQIHLSRARRRELVAA